MCSSFLSCLAPSWPEGSGGHGEALKHAEEADTRSVWPFTHIPSLEMPFPEARSVCLTGLKERIHNRERSRTLRSSGRRKNMTKIYCMKILKSIQRRMYIQSPEVKG